MFSSKSVLPNIAEKCVMDDPDRNHNTLPKPENKVVVIPRRKHSKANDKSQNKIKLEHVLGLTVSSNAALDCDQKTGTIVYPAGCAVIFLCPFRERQTHLLNTSRKSITCLVYSPDGRYLATGEYGHQPSVRVWDLTDNSQCAEFSSHKCGINCVVFSPNQKYLVSIGSQHDMIINIWDWKSQVKIGSNKVSAKIKAVSFSENGDYFVTVGNRHVKFWYLQASRHSLYKDPVPIMGRSAILGEQRNNDFVDVVCGKSEFQDVAYVITKTGILCEFNGRRLLDRWVDVKTTTAYCISAGKHLIFIGCADSIIRCFSTFSLEFVTTLPRTHYLGVDVAKALTISHTTSHPKNSRYPDTVALAFDDVHKKLTAIYNDHSLYIWDVKDIKKVGKSHSYLYHCSCIWGVEVYPHTNDNDEIIPAGSFITCSSDDTIRFWNLDKHKNNYNNETVYQPNIYSNELMKIIYVDPELQFLKDADITLADKMEHLAYDGRNGVRSLGISYDGLQLASGDRSGNIRIYDIKSTNELCKIEAHDAEVLCLEFSPSLSNDKQMLVSSSRDRLVHVFNANEFEFIETLDDHSSSITAVRFLNFNNQPQLVSCSADKSIVFRKYQNGVTKDSNFVREKVIAGKCTLYDMAVDSSQKYILTACQDRNIRVYNVSNGKHCKTFKGSVGEEGSIIKIALDNSGRYLATSCTDKTLCIYDYYSGECITCISGHSELVTGLRFSNNCEYLISASGDGCIFIWRLAHDMVVTMQARLAQQLSRSSSRLHLAYDTGDESVNESKEKVVLNNEVPTNTKYTDRLPLWVTKSMNDESGLLPESGKRVMLPKGRWAQRLDFPVVPDGLIPLPTSHESDGSKDDSSIDSGTETCRLDDRHENLIIPQKTIRLRPKFITDSDNGVDEATRETRIHQRHAHRTDLSDINKIRQHTDDSSLGSFKNEDIESTTEHDGDIEDYLEAESGENDLNRTVLYYPSVETPLCEFTVNAMDEEELRKSQRKMKRNSLIKKGLILNTDVSSCSVSGSQESDHDDDCSTPSADNSEKNNFSLTSNRDDLDTFEQREKYLKNTYDSLSGSVNNLDYQEKRTISSQHHNSKIEVRNIAVIEAAKQNRSDAETNKKRQELKSRIEDIKEKLQCVGYQSSLKSSQSTLDLRKHDEFLAPFSPQKKIVPVSEESSVGMRRSCSLSDLSPVDLRLNNQIGSKSADRRISSSKQHINTSKLQEHNSSKPPIAARSISRSNSEISLIEGTSNHRRLLRHAGSNTSSAMSQRIMRPTVSWQNKVKTNTANLKSNNYLPLRRRSQTSVSYMELNEIANIEDSSSEDSKSERYPAGGIIADKSLVKRLNSSSKFLERSCSERDLTSLSYLPLRKKHCQMSEAKSELQLFTTLPDVKNTPLSCDLLNLVVEQFKKTADNVVCMHERLTMENIDENEKKNLLADLRSTISRVQNSLRSVENVIKSSSSNDKSSDVKHQSLSSSATPSIIVNSTNGNNLTTIPQSDNMLSIIQQYSDVLVSLVQKKVDNSQNGDS